MSRKITLEKISKAKEEVLQLQSKFAEQNNWKAGLYFWHKYCENGEHVIVLELDDVLVYERIKENERNKK